MKFTLDTTNKKIMLFDDCNLVELYNFLDNILKDDLKNYSIISNNIPISTYTNPISTYTTPSFNIPKLPTLPNEPIYVPLGT